MTGALYQLNAKGQQDLFFTGNPEVNFIQQVWKEYTNFATEKIRLISPEYVDFGKKITVKLHKKGDFINKIWFNFSLPVLTPTSGTSAGWTNTIGHAIIKHVDLYIGNQMVDRHYGIWMEIWYELTHIPSLCDTDDLLLGKYMNIQQTLVNATTQTNYYVPLQFWFCNEIGSSLPVFCLDFHEVRLELKLRPFSECIVYDGTTPPLPVKILNSCFIAEYIYVDDSFKKHYKFLDYGESQIQQLNQSELTASGGRKYREHRFLITQNYQTVKTSLNSGNSNVVDLPFNNAISELAFVIQDDQSLANNDWFNFAQRNSVVHTPVLGFLNKANLLMDNHKRNDDDLTGEELSLINNQRHTNNTDKYIYTMQFCEYPEKLQPSGSLNFSRFSSAVLTINLVPNTPPVTLYVFARSYNFFYINEGLSSIAFNC